MKKLRLKDLNPKNGDHILTGIIPGKYLSQGGMGFKKPNQRSHDTGCDCPACDGSGRHVHEDNEVFVILQGKGYIEINGENHNFRAGDVIVCEPGEDHHLVADEEDPCVNLFLHAGDIRKIVS